MRLFYVFLIGIVFSVSSQNASKIDFKIRNLGVNVDGHFNTFSITTKYDTGGALTKLKGEIKVNSIKTGIDKRDKHLLKKDYFYTSKFPLITLESTLIKKMSSTEYQVKAKLTIKGKTKVITIPVSVENAKSTRKITSNFQINRQDFNIGGGSFVMSKTVKLSVVHMEKNQ